MVLGIILFITFILIFNYQAHKKDDAIDRMINKWNREEMDKKDQRP